MGDLCDRRRQTVSYRKTCAEPLAREQALLKVPDLTFWVVYDETIRQDAPGILDDSHRPETERTGWMGKHPSLVSALIHIKEACCAAAAGIDAAQFSWKPIAAYNAAVEYRPTTRSGASPPAAPDRERSVLRGETSRRRRNDDPGHFQ